MIGFRDVRFCGDFNAPSLSPRRTGDMHRKASVLLGAVALATVTGSAFAQRQINTAVDTAGNQVLPTWQGSGTSVLPVVLYQNVPTGAETVFTTTSAPRTGGADEALFNGPGANLTSMKFGFSVATGGPAAFDARVRIWDDLEPTGSTVAGVPQFVNLAREFTVSFTGQTAGAFITTDIAIPGGALVTANPVNLGVPNVTDAYVQLDFFQPGTTTPVAANAVTYLFDGSGVNVGRTFSEPAFGGDNTPLTSIYWRDANGNGTISVEEARNFGGAAGSFANFVLELNGDIVPEPASLSLIGLAGMSLIRRRRQA
jgi:hypothetical protein